MAVICSCVFTFAKIYHLLFLSITSPKDVRDDFYMKKILLTGGTGILGAALGNHLKSLGFNVIASTHADGDLRDREYCRKIMKDVDHLFHLASFRRNVAYHLEHRDEVLAGNTDMTDALGSVLSENKRPIPVTFFSTAILGTMAPSVSALDIEDGYAAGKLHCENHWREACAEIGSPLLIVRPASVYGPGDNFGPEANVIPSLIRKCMDAKDALTVWGSGKQMRSFLYAQDIGPALMALIDGGVTGTQYICPPERVSIGKLAEMIRDIARPGLAIEFDTTKPEGPSFPEFPVHAMLKDVGWTGLEEGLRETVGWYKASQQ